MDNLSDIKRALPGKGSGKGKSYSSALSEEQMREQRRVREQKFDSDIAKSKPPSIKWERGRNNSPSPQDTKKSHENIVHSVCSTSNSASCSSSTPPAAVKKPVKIDPQPYINAENPDFPFMKGVGVIGWRFEGKRLQFLMSRKNGKLDCFGGKVEYGIDSDSAATAAREFVEEVSCEPYLYLMDLYPEDCSTLLKDAQAYFEPLIRRDRNLVRDGIAWGVYFCEFPNIPVNCFREREDMLTCDDGDLFKAEWVDVWQLCNRTALAGRLSYLNMSGALDLIYIQDAKRNK